MALSDPTSGSGYSTGQKLPSTHMTTIATQQVRALDAVNGGSYTLVSTLTADGSSTVTLNWVTVNVGSSSLWTWQGTNLPRIASRTYKRVQPLIAAGTTTFSGGSDFSTAPVGALLTQNYVDTGGTNDPYCLIPLSNLIDLATLTQIDLTIDPVNSSTAAEKPEMTIMRGGAGAPVQVGSTVVDGTSGAGYQAEHTITTGVISVSIDHADELDYYLRIKGESGAGSVAGLVIRKLVCSFTAVRVTPGG